MLQFAISNGGGLLVFSADEITLLVTEYMRANDAITSNTSTLIVSLATFLITFYSSKARPEITFQIRSLFDVFTSILPVTEIPPLATFPIDALEQPLIAPFRALLAANPELSFRL